MLNFNWFAGAITLACLQAPGLAQEPSQSFAAANEAQVNFTLPFSKALELARKQNRLLFLKPVYGGLDAAGAMNYRDGSW